MESIQYAKLSDGIVVIRVRGRGSHHNSPALREIFDLTRSPEFGVRYIMDMDGCVSLDSTFMGVMATLGLHQNRVSQTQTVVLNLSPRVKEQLDLLGLKYILEMRGGAPTGGESLPVAPGEFSSVHPPRIGKVAKLVHMIEAHENLIDIDGENEIKFRDVIETLRDSLERHGEIET